MRLLAVHCTGFTVAFSLPISFLSMDKPTLKRLLIGKFTWKRLVRSLILIYAFLCVYAYFFTDRMIFLPQSSSYRDTNDILKLTTSDGAQISAFYLPNPKAELTILYSHGNAEDLGDIKPLLGKLKDMGFAMFSYDYRGYGTSEGTPTESRVYCDIDAAYQYLTETLGISPRRIILYGRSVGSGPAVDLASRKTVGGLILESPFITAFRVVTRVPIVPVDKFRNINKIRKVHSPVLVMHSQADEVIPFSHGKRIFEAANEPKHFLAVEQAGHNDLMEVETEQYTKALHEFAQVVTQFQQLALLE